MTTAIVWFRQDLRLSENPAFFEACTAYDSVLPLYILDGKQSVLGEAQAWWLHHSLTALTDSLQQQFGLTLVIRRGSPSEIIEAIADTLPIDGVYWNRCYEPLAIARDTSIKTDLKARGISVHTFNGSLLHEPWTIHNKQGEYFKVFTPYWKTCRKVLTCPPITEIQKRLHAFQIESETLDSLRLLPRLNWASAFSEYWTPGEAGAQARLASFVTNELHGYKVARDFPAVQATSRLSPHLHFGEISPWAVVRAVEEAKLDPRADLAGAEHFLSELGWREFSYYLLYHFPTLPQENFKPEFDAFPWEHDDELLSRWQKGQTGYPLVDAGMRELWATGYIHNRVRMIAASFLVKDLLIDWRVGADWFLDTLVDADLANNSAGWQWVAGSGADAAPYFRIFNPVLQSQKFDPEGRYIRRWVPELSGFCKNQIHAPWEMGEGRLKVDYPAPIVNHNEARVKALTYYKKLKAPRRQGYL